MSRYIDADVFAERMMRVWDDADKRGRKDISRFFADIVTPLLVGTPTADVAPVVHARWEWFEEWTLSTPDYPRECDDCGWRCSECKTVLEDMVGGYWDDIYDTPKLAFCPNCGAKMDGEEKRCLNESM